MAHVSIGEQTIQKEIGVFSCSIVVQVTRNGAVHTTCTTKVMRVLATILHSYLRGLRTNGPELQASIDNMDSPPDLVCLNETNFIFAH